MIINAIAQIRGESMMVKVKNNRRSKMKIEREL